MQGEVFLATMAVHLMPHRLKHLRVAGNWADCEELQYYTPIISDGKPTNKGVMCIYVVRRILFLTNRSRPALSRGHAFEADNETVLEQQA